MAQFQRIVCPTDFSTTATHAVTMAASMASSFGAELVLLHVIPEFEYPIRGLGMASSFPHLREELHTRARERLEETKASLGPNLKVRTEVRDGDPYEQILACARTDKADLIVLGTHGHTGIRHALLGSTAERVVRLSECPVLTVRTK